MKSRATIGLWAFAVALFAAGVAVHVWCGDFPKGIDVLPDERRYLDIARSLFAGGDLIIRGASSDFQKILYPLSLFPALMLDGSEAQIGAVNVLNSIYTCSTVFPAMLIARKLFRTWPPIACCAVLAIITPDLMYSMTFMSESVFMPLTLWLVLLCWRCFESTGKRELVLSACAGLLCYVTYLCKEVAWMFLIAFVVLYIVAAARKRRSKAGAVSCISLFVLGFFVPFAIMKLTLFSGLFNSYSQFSFDILVSPYTVLFGLYSAAVDGVYFIVGFGVFPILFVACTYGELTREERDLALFCLVSMLVGLAVVVFTISMREDVGHVALRQHLRYVAPLTLPLLFLFLRQAVRLRPENVTGNPRRLATLVGVTTGFCCLVAAFFGTANLSQGFDFSQFHFMRWLLDDAQALPQERLSSWGQPLVPIDTDDGELLAIEPLIWACRAAVIAFTVAGMALLLNRRRNVRHGAAAAIVMVIAGFMVANSVCAFDYNRNAYDVEQSEVEEICALSEQMASLPGDEEVIVLLDDSNTRPNNLIDTYLQDGAGNYRYLDADAFEGYLYPGFERSVPRDTVGYVLANKKQKLGKAAEAAEVIGGRGESGGNFLLYRINREKLEQTSDDPDGPDGLVSRLTGRILADS